MNKEKKDKFIETKNNILDNIKKDKKLNFEQLMAKINNNNNKMIKEINNNKLVEKKKFQDQLEDNFKVKIKEHKFSLPTTKNMQKSSSLAELFQQNFKLNEDPYDARKIMSQINKFKKEVKINNLKINLIYFYEDMSQENIHLYNQLKLEVLGGFYGCREGKIFKTLISEIENNNSPFIVISIGSSFEKIYKACKKSHCVKYIILFCANTYHYSNLYKSEKKILLISDDVLQIKDILFSLSEQFHNYDRSLKYLIEHNQIISFYEYEEFYNINHKILSLFFKEDFSILPFNKEYMEYVFHFIDNETNYSKTEKKELKHILRQLKDSDNFVKDSLKFYNSENKFIYLLNKTMRNLETGKTRLSFLVGPMYYGIIRYLLEKNPKKQLNKSTTLYRDIIINEYDLNTYYMTEGTIICFSSFTSTSFISGFIPTENAKNVNNIIDEDKVSLQMIINYEHKFHNVPQGMVLKNYSTNQFENEVLLFPYTFIKVRKLEKVKDNSYRLYCKIINKNSILEFGLKKGKKVILDNQILTLV